MYTSMFALTSTFSYAYGKTLSATLRYLPDSSIPYINALTEAGRTRPWAQTLIFSHITGTPRVVDFWEAFWETYEWPPYRTYGSTVVIHEQLPMAVRVSLMVLLSLLSFVAGIWSVLRRADASSTVPVQTNKFSTLVRNPRIVKTASSRRPIGTVRLQKSLGDVQDSNKTFPLVPPGKLRITAPPESCILGPLHKSSGAVRNIEKTVPLAPLGNRLRSAMIPNSECALVSVKVTVLRQMSRTLAVLGDPRALNTTKVTLLLPRDVLTAIPRQIAFNVDAATQASVVLDVTRRHATVKITPKLTDAKRGEDPVILSVGGLGLGLARARLSPLSMGFFGAQR